MIEGLQGVDHIIHAGDIDKKEVLDELEKIAPVTAVRGNADKDWAVYLPEKALLEFEGNKIYVIHNKGMIDDFIDDLQENETVKKVQEKVADVIEDIKSNETVKQTMQKVDETLDQIAKSETAKQAQEFIKDSASKAGDVINQAADEIQKTSLWQKIKNLFK